MLLVIPICTEPFVAPADEVLPVNAVVPVTSKSSVICTVPPAESNIRLPVTVSISVSAVTPILISSMCAPDQGRAAEPSAAPSSESGSNEVLNVTAPMNVLIPAILTSPPTFKFLSNPIPPSVIIDPVSVLFDCKSFVSSMLLFNFNVPLSVVEPLTLMSLLKLTGPSNLDRTLLDLPPSTIILSLTVTSSNTTDNLEGSCPVTVGTGASNVLSCPVVELTLLLPI